MSLIRTHLRRQKIPFLNKQSSIIKSNFELSHQNFFKLFPKNNEILQVSPN